MSAADTGPLPLPARVLRHLLRRGWGRRARSVLDVGCSDRSVLRQLTRRGCEALAFDDSAAGEGEAKVHHGQISAGCPIPPGSLDLVIVRASNLYDGDLDSPEAMIGTANLLSSLAPRRRLIFIKPATEQNGPPQDPARVDQLVAHLRRFVDRVDVRPYRDGRGRWLSLEYLLGRSPSAALTLIVAESPRKPISRLQWHQKAREAAMSVAAQRTERAA
jgi:hypothetical protein